MDIKIFNARGNGEFGANIDEEGNLHTFTVAEGADRNKNKQGESWAIDFTVTPVGAGDLFFYFSNTGNVPYTITDLRAVCAAAETIDMIQVIGTPTFVVGTDIPPATKNTGSSKTIAATIKSDTNITGLTQDVGPMYFMTLFPIGEMQHLQMSANAIVVPGSAIVLKATTGTAAIRCILSISTINDVTV